MEIPKPEIKNRSGNNSEQEIISQEYIERRERERGGAFDFHVSIPKVFKEDKEVDLERMQEIIQLIRAELGGKIKAKHFVEIKNYDDPRTGHDPREPGLMLTQVLPNYQQSIERVNALLELLKRENLNDVSFEIENIMPALKNAEDKERDADIDPNIAFDQLQGIGEKEPKAPTHETHYGWKGRIGGVPDYNWIKENVEKVTNRSIHQIVDFSEFSSEEITDILEKVSKELSGLIIGLESNINGDTKVVLSELLKSLKSAQESKDKNNLAKTIIETLKELENVKDGLSDDDAIKLQENIDALWIKLPHITRVATTYEDNRSAVRETANNLKLTRSQLNWSWAEPEQVIAVGHLKE